MVKRKKCRICDKAYKPVKIVFTDAEPMEFLFPDCNCEADKYDNYHKQKAIVKLLEESNIYDARWNDDLKDFRWVEGYNDTRVVFGNYIKHLEKNLKNKIGMFLLGPKGTGKTRLSCSILVRIIREMCVPAQYYHITELFDLFRDPDSRYETLARCRNVPVLLIDDIGESLGDYWVRIYLKLIINSRYEKKKVTFFNSMRSITELQKEEYLGAHMLSRVVEMCAGHTAEIQTTVDWRTA